MNDQSGPNENKSPDPQSLNGVRPDGKGPPASGPQEPHPARPGIEHFDRWIQRRLVPAMGGVIVVAFLFKAFVPSRYGFSLGLLLGILLLLAVYLIDFYRR